MSKKDNTLESKKPTLKSSILMFLVSAALAYFSIMTLLFGEQRLNFIIPGLFAALFFFVGKFNLNKWLQYGKQKVDES